ncbi:hypothetical protein DICPUDRAFT_95036 [Dictyostelium purpureum]|uniref:G-protein coupled receptors family 2 profile 2 domain-containing protein n=1 Tax=Dictyostelium purpureum TaxID=5786 RepID=F0ZRG6_DICPU|nr:uncharacterized protein DICPUDRAFT_95036 [Dictyostelium purpureum]EGC33439.1 hypothetical protein DICPUDRAFT_95036 [Dictyostelium purpureum]|eukprot:XP_003290010.1 hypothetical protein DICPUDRAFT_95036 [Dictyostelium purpureum]
MATDNDTLNDVLSYITDVLLCLSIVGSFFTVFTFMVFYKLRTYPIRLIIYLCLSILFAQFFFEISFRSSENLFCLPSGILLHYFFLADFVWTFCVAFNFYQMIVKRNRDAESLEKYYHLASWGIPLLVVVFCAGFEKYINRGGFCYLENDLPVFLGFFVPGLLVVCANAVIFFFIAREIHDTLKNAPRTDKKEKSKEFRVYFSIFVSIGLSWIFGFIMTFFNSDSVLGYIFLILFSVTTPLQGFLIFVSYCVNDKVLAHYARGFKSIGIPIFSRWENLDGTSTRQTSTTGPNSDNTDKSDMSNNLSSDSSISIKAPNS